MCGWQAQEKDVEQRQLRRCHELGLNSISISNPQKFVCLFSEGFSCACGWVYENPLCTGMSL